MSYNRKLAFGGVLILTLVLEWGSSSLRPNSVLEQPADLLGMVENVAGPWVNQVKTVIVKYEISTLARAITVKAIGKNIVPTPQNFRQYVRDTMQSSRDSSVDMWGSPYIFERKGKTGLIISLGPDKKRGTPDDIVEEVSLP